VRSPAYVGRRKSEDPSASVVIHGTRHLHASKRLPHAYGVSSGHYALITIGDEVEFRECDDELPRNAVQVSRLVCREADAF